MTTGHHERHKRRFQIRCREEIGKDMPFQMIDADKRFAQRKRQRLSRRHANQKCPHETRAIRYGHLVDIFKFHAGRAQALINYRHNIYDMFAGGNFRHHPAKFLMNGNLRGDDIGKNLPSAPQNCRRSFITAGLYCQRQQFFLFLFHKNFRHLIYTIRVSYST